MKTPALDILLICNAPGDLHGKTANTLFDYISSFEKFSKHRVFVISSLGDLPPGIDMNRFDAIAVHWTIYLLGEDYISRSTLQKLKDYKGIKISFIQDEYRQIEQIRQVIKYVGFNVICTCMPDSCLDVVYPQKELPNLRRAQVLTGYLPAQLCYRVTPKIQDRSVDVFYRGRQVPYWLGRAGQEKHWIGSEFKKRAQGRGFIIDIETAETARIYGEEWIDRLSNSRVTLGVESAASILDFDTSIQRKTDAYMRDHPNATFDECEAACFPGIDGKWNTNQISPRVFEAICLRTPMVLFEGRYSDAIEPCRHYIPLKKDFSNFDEVCALIRDTDYLQEIADTACSEVAFNRKFTYQHFMEIFDNAVSAEAASREEVYFENGAHKAAVRAPSGKVNKSAARSTSKKLSASQEFTRDLAAHRVWKRGPRLTRAEFDAMARVPASPKTLPLEQEPEIVLHPAQNGESKSESMPPNAIIANVEAFCTRLKEHVRGRIRSFKSAVIVPKNDR